MLIPILASVSPLVLPSAPTTARPGPSWRGPTRCLGFSSVSVLTSAGPPTRIPVLLTGPLPVDEPELISRGTSSSSRSLLRRLSGPLDRSMMIGAPYYCRGLDIQVGSRSTLLPGSSTVRSSTILIMTMVQNKSTTSMCVSRTVPSLPVVRPGSSWAPPPIRTTASPT
jgi:hypothetical protein